MSRGGRVHQTRVLAEAWHIASQIAFLDPDVLVEPFLDPVEGHSLVLHKPRSDGAAVSIGARSGVRVNGPAGASLRLWPSVFAQSTYSVVAESVDAAVWAQGSKTITTSSAAAAYLAISAAFDVVGAASSKVVVRNRWEPGLESGSGHLCALSPFITAISDAEEESQIALARGATVRPARWWLLSMYGSMKAVFDDQEGVLHTPTRRAVLPQGEGLDARRAILAIMMEAMSTPA